MAPRKSTAKHQKRKADNSGTRAAAKRARTANDDTTSSSMKEPSAAPSNSRRVPAMTEEEDTTSHVDDAIPISSDNESEAESSEAELGRSQIYVMSLTTRRNAVLSI